MKFRTKQKRASRFMREVNKHRRRRLDSHLRWSRAVVMEELRKTPIDELRSKLRELGVLP